jgi:chemotaxis protein CheC
MELTPAQKAALKELLNIGFGRAAASLSQLTGHEVLLDIPAVSIHPLAQLRPALAEVVRDDVASVHQIFSGPVAGNALLILNHEAAGLLKQLLTDETPLPLNIDASGREALTEVGNILLNACLVTVGHLLDEQVSFSIPYLDLDTLQRIIDPLLVSRESLRYGLLVQAGFRLRDTEVHGYLVIALSEPSHDRLIKAIEVRERKGGPWL